MVKNWICGEIKMSYPLLSILVLSYNNGDYIFETLHSILHQDYPNLELLIGDDASSYFDRDGIESYLQDHSGNNITNASICINEKNLKTCANLEHLLSLAKGDYITIIAADDAYFGNDALSSLMHFFEKDPHLDIVMGHTLMYDGTDLVGPNHVFSQKEDVELVNSGNSLKLFEALASKLFLPAMGIIFRRDVFTRIGSLSVQYQYVEDWPTQLRCARMGMRMHFLDKAVAKHRGGGISQNRGKKIFLDFHEDMLQIVKKEIFPYMKQFSVEGKKEIQHRYEEILRVYQEAKKEILSGEETLSSKNLLPEKIDFSLLHHSLSAPLYTIILLHYRQEYFYQEALDSIFSQNYPNLELIFADDATPDLDQSSIKDYIEQHKTPNIKAVSYIFNETNIGTVRTLQKAISLAQGKYLQFFAADDAIATPTSISRIVKIFETEKRCGKVLATRTAMMDFGLQKQLWFRPLPEQQKQLELIKDPHELFKMTCTSCIFGISSMTFQTSLFNEYPYLDETKNKLIEDWPLILRLSRRGEAIYYADFPTLLHRDGGISNRLGRGVSQLQQEFERENLKTIEQDILPYLHELPMPEQVATYVFYQDTVQRYKTKFGKWKSRALQKLFFSNKPLTIRLLKNWIVARQDTVKSASRNTIQECGWLTGISFLCFFILGESWITAGLFLLSLIAFSGAFLLYILVYMVEILRNKGIY